MRGDDKQRAAPPRAKLGKSGPLIGTLKGGTGLRWRGDRLLDRNTGTGPAVMILPWNIVELALDFHGDGLAGPPPRDWPLVSTFSDQPGRADAIAPRHHADDR